MGEIIKVGMADLNVCHSPDAITTLGLGSCVGIVLYDSVSKIAGLAHIMLPDSTQIKNNQNVAKFADTGIEALIHRMRQCGAKKERFIAKLAGGAQMFAFQSNHDMLRIGERNIQASKYNLSLHNIPIAAEDVGLNYGRTIEFYPETGKLYIRSVGKATKTI